MIMREAGLLILVLIPTLVVILVMLYLRHRSLQMLHQERMAALEKGAAVPVGHAAYPLAKKALALAPGSTSVHQAYWNAVMGSREIAADRKLQEVETDVIAFLHARGDRPGVLHAESRRSSYKSQGEYDRAIAWATGMGHDALGWVLLAEDCPAEADAARMDSVQTRPGLDGFCVVSS